METNNSDLNNLISEVVKDPEVRRRATFKSHSLFFPIYFPHYIKFSKPHFHDEIFAITEDNEIKMAVVESFRGSSKTTLIGMSYPIWAILGEQQKKFVLILAQTQDQARQSLANIKTELESNEVLKQDLGPFEEPDDEWRATSIVIPKYGARVTVASIDKPVRGLRHGEHRPDLIICDDLEDLDSVKTMESRDKLYRWIMGDVIPLGDNNTKIIVIGTRLHNDSLISRLRKDIEENRMSGIFKSFPLMDEQGVITWPGKFPNQDAITELRMKVPSEAAWSREYLLKIIDEETQVIKEGWIQYYDDFSKEDYRDFRYPITGIDLAISQKNSADFTAMVSARVYSRGENLKIYVLPNPINEHLDFPETIERAKNISKTLGEGFPSKLIIEDVGYQQAVIQQLKNMNFPAEGFRPQGQDKQERLSSVSNLIQQGRVLFPKNGAKPLIQQLLGFGVERNDDMVDALVMVLLYVMGNSSGPGFICLPPYGTPPKGTPPKTQKELERDADIAVIMEQEYERMTFNRMMRRDPRRRGRY